MFYKVLYLVAGNQDHIVKNDKRSLQISAEYSFGAFRCPAFLVAVVPLAENEKELFLAQPPATPALPPQTHLQRAVEPECFCLVQPCSKEC